MCALEWNLLSSWVWWLWKGFISSCSISTIPHSKPIISNGVTGKAGGWVMMKIWTDFFGKPQCAQRQRKRESRIKCEGGGKKESVESQNDHVVTEQEMNWELDTYCCGGGGRGRGVGRSFCARKKRTNILIKHLWRVYTFEYHGLHLDGVSMP